MSEILKICNCGKEFYVLPYRSNTAKYCSNKCRVFYREYKINKGSFKEGEIEYLRRREKVPIICGVYKITNSLGEIYIGSSRTIYRRWLRHREAKKNVPIHHSIKKYGWRSHKWEIVSKLPNDILDIDLINQEQVYIDAYLNCGFKLLNVMKAGHYLKQQQ